MDPTILNARALLELNDAEYEQNETPRCSRDLHPALKLAVIVAGLLGLCIAARVSIRLIVDAIA